MKIILLTIVIFAVCSLYAAGSPAGGIESEKIDNYENARFFFGGDPCANMLFTKLNISDFKCSLQCFFQGGTQQGGYCDNGACQCNVIT